MRSTEFECSSSFSCIFNLQCKISLRLRDSAAIFGQKNPVDPEKICPKGKLGQKCGQNFEPGAIWTKKKDETSVRTKVQCLTLQLPGVLTSSRG